MTTPPEEPQGRMPTVNLCSDCTSRGSFDAAKKGEIWARLVPCGKFPESTLTEARRECQGKLWSRG